MGSIRGIVAGGAKRTGAAMLAGALLCGCSPNADPAADEEPTVSSMQRGLPPIPVALRGCWRLDDDEITDHDSRLDITADSIIETAEWRPVAVVATPDYVTHVNETQIDGLFSAPEGAGRMTVATRLSLGADDLGTQDGKLLLSEGDAGSRWYSRCDAK
jgi:hypothetical protein